MCTLRLQRSGCSAGSVIKRRSGAGSGSRCASQHPTIPHIAHCRWTFLKHYCPHLTSFRTRTRTQAAREPGKFQYWVSKYLNIKILCPHTLCLFPNCQSNEIVKLFRLLKILLIHQLEYLHDLQFCVK